ADPRGAADTVIFSVEVLEHVPQIFAIEKVHGGLLGTVQEVSITRVAGTEPISGFTFLIAFDTPPLSFMSAEPGVGLINCGWEYFTYNYIPTGENCDIDCPASLVRITAIADVTEIGGTPSCGQLGQGTELARLKFYVTLDRHFECYSMPVRFAWLNCGDNTALSTNSDTLWISERVFDIQNFDPFNDPNFEITDLTCHDSVSFGGACSDCEVISPVPTVRDIYFLNGYIDNACDGFPSAGDLNLNGISFEIADAKVYADYFLYGLAALDPNPYYRSEQIVQSDANQDGTVLTPADLTYLLRVIVGDASPYPKLQPLSSFVEVDVLGGRVSYESADSIGVAFMSFEITGDVKITNHTDLQLNYAEREGELRVLLWPGFDDMTNYLAAGLNEIVTVEGAELESAMLSDYDGNVMVVHITKHSLPTQFALSQNYPNPFNPLTRIEIGLPEIGEWSLDIINISGQVVKSFRGRDIGIVRVEWDASDQPSGVYFYRVASGAFTDTKKMVLLK
ncbi:MAG: T9SS type A sorting domain-containing protein, partial [Candidatus Zixiibacteriota bacterium]